jgi:hypothetical protein
MGVPTWPPALPYRLPPPFDQYTLVEPLGEPGGQGVVFLADDARNVAQPQCAIKFPHVPDVDAFLREASAGTSFNYKHLARTRHLLDCRQCGAAWPCAYPPVGQVMNYYPVTLALLRCVLPGHRFAPCQIAEWVRHLAWAVDHLHARGLVHRDVKPGNIFFELPHGRRFCGAESLDGATLLLGDFGTLGPLDEPAAVTVCREANDPWKDPRHYPTVAAAAPSAQRCTAAMDVSSVGRVLGLFVEMTGGNADWLRHAASCCAQDAPPRAADLIERLSPDWDEQARLFRTAGHCPQDHPHFVPRTNWRQRFDEFAETRHDRGGVFVLVADAGVGKTAFLTHWAESTGQPFGYYFRYRDNRTAAADMPRALAEQLRLRFAADETLPADENELTRFLERLLARAAESADCPRPLFLFVDGFDEADDPTRAVQFLPKALPASVFVIASTRPPARGRDHLALLRNAGAHVCEVRANDPDNVRDVATYLRNTLTGSITPGEADAVADTTGGIFLLATLLVEAIRAGTLTVAHAVAMKRRWTELGVEPSGRLAAYYKESWERVTEGQDAVAMAQFAGLMAAALHWVTEVQIVEFLNHYAGGAGGACRAWDPFRLRELLRQLSWFVARRVSESNPPSYQVRHQSVRDYLLSPDGPVPPEGLRLMHAAVGTFYVEEARKQRRGWESVDPYGRFFAVRHLTQSGAADHLRTARDLLCDLGYLQATVGDRSETDTGEARS